MAEENKINIPDIGGAAEVDVIEVLVQVGDEISKETSLLTLESDKASMEIPSPKAGIVKEVSLKVGDKVSEGDLILILEDMNESYSDDKKEEASKEQESKSIKQNSPADSKAQKKFIEKEKTEQIKKIQIPDIGDATDVDVIEVMIQPGDEITKDQSLITLEGDKATMDIPAPEAGTVESVEIKVGDKASQGDMILTLRVSAGDEQAPESAALEKQTRQEEPELIKKEKSTEEPAAPESYKAEEKETLVPAGPAVRRLAREFGVDLEKVKGTARKSRVTKEDVQNYVKTKLSEKEVTAGGLSIAAAPEIDFSKFGETEVKKLNKIKRLTGANVHRAWVTIPHVTQFDEADITDLEAFRKSEQENAKKAGYKLTMLAFAMKIVAKALAEFPQFNASLDASGENLIYKKYFNIGIAVETDNGLVVPVIKDVNHLSVADIAKEMSRLSSKARDKGLMPGDMSGGCFTISSLGGIGGTAFTPIVNGPEVAILGLSRSTIKPVYQNNQFVPRLMLPLSLSYDHRVIDGAEAARFTRYLAESLGDIRRVLL